MKKCVSISLDSDTWSRFQGIAKLSGIMPSSVIESLLRAFLSHMRAGDDLRLELADMISFYSENKDLESEVCLPDFETKKPKGRGKKKKISP